MSWTSSSRDSDFVSIGTGCHLVVRRGAASCGCITLACLVENGDAGTVGRAGWSVALAVSNSFAYIEIDACVSLNIVSFSKWEFIFIEGKSESLLKNIPCI